MRRAESQQAPESETGWRKKETLQAIKIMLKPSILHLGECSPRLTLINLFICEAAENEWQHLEITLKAILEGAAGLQRRNGGHASVSAGDLWRRLHNGERRDRGRSITSAGRDTGSILHPAAVKHKGRRNSYEWRRFCTKEEDLTESQQLREIDLLTGRRESKEPTLRLKRPFPVKSSDHYFVFINLLENEAWKKEFISDQFKRQPNEF